MKVFVSGCFDMLHTGHIAFFEEASKLGELYVGIGSDSNILKIKGRQTVNKQNERLYAVKSIKYVHDAWVNSGNGLLDFEKEVLELKPDVFFVNEDGYSAEKQAFCDKYDNLFRKMKNILIICLMSIFMCSGCTTTLCDIQRTDSDNEILINEIYYNEKTHGFQVFQVLDDGILVCHPSIERFISYTGGGMHYAIEEAEVEHEYFLDAYITSILNDYVDEQNLKTGWYKYIGIYEYNTVENKKRKVRHFIEVEKE